MGNHAPESGGSINVQGETQKKLDVLSNSVFIRRTEWSGNLAGMASEEMDVPYQIPAQYPRGKYLLVFGPARWFQQHRRECVGRQRVFGPARRR